MLFYQHRKSRCGDQTIVRSSYLHNGNPYTGKTVPVYQIIYKKPFHEQSLESRHEWSIIHVGYLLSRPEFPEDPAKIDIPYKFIFEF